MIKWYFLTLLITILIGCKKTEDRNPFAPNAPKASVRTASLGIIGDSSDVKTVTKAGLVIMGGGNDVDAAFRWMIARSGGGDIVVIRATGTDAYNEYVRSLGNIHSVETLKIDSRTLANDPKVAHVIRNAEMLFIAGGDQSDYVNYWKGTKVMDAINYLLQEKKVPVGGTSAGAAIFGNYYYAAEKGGVDSPEALANPYYEKITLRKDDFLKVPYLEKIITDQHFSQRNREGRLAVFLGRILMDWNKDINAIAVDEKTAVCIDENGIATVFGNNKAFFLKTTLANKPEVFKEGNSMTWNNGGKAMRASAIEGTVQNNKFDIHNFEPIGTIGWNHNWWFINSGSLIQAD